MKNQKFLFYLLVIFSLIFLKKALAVCPLCTVFVAGGLGLSRYLGIDDTISGLWIGGLIVSLIIWTNNWLDKKEGKIKKLKPLVAGGYFLLVILPLYWQGFIGHPFHTLWGIDKLILGIFLGSGGFLLGSIFYAYLKKKKGKPHFPFQKVLMPIFPLIVLSIVFYFLIK